MLERKFEKAAPPLFLGGGGGLVGELGHLYHRNLILSTGILDMFCRNSNMIIHLEIACIRYNLLTVPF
ncbi:hypothetical protein CH365_09265 [Leptospira neocaledonica]|uniref:Uncharacterized protein n=1 Tax=Leptospira neocaledonica TaxID=2023192 RepID=A0A2M9ZY35_9LEPT|nr:hypothetical protein CH365_09265 [Leptospira neocaledonica]